MKKISKKYQILLLVISIMLIISGVSYAYFSIANQKGNPNIVTSGVMKITFTDGPSITLDNAIPGDSVIKTFTVKNTGTVATNYDLYFSDLINTFGDPTDLVYTLTSSDGGYNTNKEVEVPTTSSKMVNSYAIEPNITQSYTLTIKFLNKEENQDDNQGKMFSSKISVNDYELLKSYSVKYGMLANVNGVLSDNVPTSSENYQVNKVSCTNNATGIWDESDWSLKTSNVSKSGTSCTVYFVSSFKDSTGAHRPELYQGLIPVTYDASGNTVVADTSKEWYNYANHNWANAVLVNASDATIKAKYFNDDMTLKSNIIGTTISEINILQYYVWIPRYKYLLWNAENGSSNPQAISITFENKYDNKSNGTTNGTWLTHPAFTFGNTELNGIWVGKFENSGSTTSLKILPNVQSLTNLTVGDMFNATRNIENSYASTYGIDATQIDTHMMKNMEWGATAYLSSSIYGRYNADATTCISSGCEVWINNISTVAGGSEGPSITGCSGTSVSASVVNLMNTCVSNYDWQTQGVNASTTGNQYGIYDMSGGVWDVVMGNSLSSSGGFLPGSSNLSQPDLKYYDTYYNQGKLGDSTREIISNLKTTNGTGAWNSDYSFLINETGPWYIRGGNKDRQQNSGIFGFSSATGVNNELSGFRSVLTQQ
jgi:hypothetical protein